MKLYCSVEHVMLRVCFTDDFSRVLLSSIADVECSDYINASILNVSLILDLLPKLVCEY